MSVRFSISFLLYLFTLPRIRLIEVSNMSTEIDDLVCSGDQSVTGGRPSKAPRRIGNAGKRRKGLSWGLIPGLIRKSPRVKPSPNIISRRGFRWDYRRFRDTTLQNGVHPGPPQNVRLFPSRVELMMTGRLSFEQGKCYWKRENPFKVQRQLRREDQRSITRRGSQWNRPCLLLDLLERSSWTSWTEK